MKQNKHIGVYGLIIKDDKILLIKKYGGPYTGKLDLPGGSIKFQETPEEALKREFLEETGISITEYELYDVDSVKFEMNFENEMVAFHHIGIFYKVYSYENEIKNSVEIDDINDDSLGACFYDIKSLNKDMLSAITILELEKLGYQIKG